MQAWASSIQTKTTSLKTLNRAFSAPAGKEALAITSYELPLHTFVAFLCISFFSSRLACDLFLGEDYKQLGELKVTEFNEIAERLVFGEIDNNGGMKIGQFQLNRSCAGSKTTITDTTTNKSIELPYTLDELRLKGLFYLFGKEIISAELGGGITTVHGFEFESILEGAEGRSVLRVKNETKDREAKFPAFESCRQLQVEALFHLTSAKEIIGADITNKKMVIAAIEYTEVATDDGNSFVMFKNTSNNEEVRLASTISSLRQLKETAIEKITSNEQERSIIKFCDLTLGFEPLQASTIDLAHRIFNAEPNTVISHSKFQKTIIVDGVVLTDYEEVDGHRRIKMRLPSSDTVIRLPKFSDMQQVVWKASEMLTVEEKTSIIFGDINLDTTPEVNKKLASMYSIYDQFSDSKKGKEIPRDLDSRGKLFADFLLNNFQYRSTLRAFFYGDQDQQRAAKLEFDNIIGSLCLNIPHPNGDVLYGFVQAVPTVCVKALDYIERVNRREIKRSELNADEIT